MKRWAWASASARGTSHIKAGTRLQDAYRCQSQIAESEYLVCVVADGAGSAEFGGEGASIVCRTIGTAVQSYLRSAGKAPSDDYIYEWIDRARDRISFAASQRSKQPRDFASTLVAVVSDGIDTVIFHVGDGCAALKNEATGEWNVPLWPDHGEYASTTSFVTDDPQAKCRIARESTPIVGLAVLTDGLERLALDFSKNVPSPGFFDGMAAAVLRRQSVGKDSVLSGQMKEFLEGEAICSRTDDDKTLVVALRK